MKFLTFACKFLTIISWFRVSSSIDAGCDLFQGRWVYDDAHPLYNASMCPFIERQFDCVGNGRPDKLYLKYRWKPRGCKLPKYQGKKIMFVGDSLTLNQWQSLTCMLHASVPQSIFSLERIGNLSTFYIQDYDFSLMFSRNAFLVDRIQGKKGTILKLDSIENGDLWKGIDVLIFNSWHWWTHKGRLTPWDYIQQDGRLFEDMDRLSAFAHALTTWSKWVDSYIDPSQTRVFFQGISPTHYNGSEWKARNAATCSGETQPITAQWVYPGEVPPAVGVVKEVVRKMKTAVRLMDVTALSAFRKDGHPSIYGIGGHRGNDCSHWCLPGVPDAWNELLSAILVSNAK